MTTRRYAVINRQRRCVNIILVDDPMPPDFYPGYGAGLIHLGPADPNEPYSEPTVTSCGLRWFPNVHPDAPLEIGDWIVLLTGRVIKWTPGLIIQRIIRRREDGSVVTDENGNPIEDDVQVSEAPLQRFFDERSGEME